MAPTIPNYKRLRNKKIEETAQVLMELGLPALTSSKFKRPQDLGYMQKPTKLVRFLHTGSLSACHCEQNCYAQAATYAQMPRITNALQGCVHKCTIYAQGYKVHTCTCSCLQNPSRWVLSTLKYLGLQLLICLGLQVHKCTTSALVPRVTSLQVHNAPRVTSAYMFVHTFTFNITQRQSESRVTSAKLQVQRDSSVATA